MDGDYRDSKFVPYAAQRRALAPSHALFDVGNWRRDFMAKENALKVLCSSVDASLIPCSFFGAISQQALLQMSKQVERMLMKDLDADAKLFAEW